MRQTEGRAGKKPSRKVSGSWECFEQRKNITSLLFKSFLWLPGETGNVEGRNPGGS